MSSEKGLGKLLTKAGYSEKAIDYYIRKLNVGIIEGAEAADSHMGFCGDSMKVYLKVKDGVIRNAKFQAIGCAGAFASGSALTEMVRGKTLKEAEKITEQDVIKDLGDLPGAKIHCARLAVDALRKTIESYTKQ
jgi:nitrogen fixation NifU-like protein